MDACRHPLMVRGSVVVSHSGDDRTATCAHCNLPVTSFWVDADDDRTAGWSRWKAAQYVINEEQEITWSALVSSGT